MSIADPTLTAAASIRIGLWTRSCAGDREAFRELATRFWYPAYAWIRACGTRPEDAARQCSDFISRLATANPPSDDDKSADRFREYMLIQLKGGLVQEWPAWTSAPLVAIDSAEANRRFAQERGGTEDIVYGRCWSFHILELAMNDLQAEFATTENERHFTAMKPFLGFRASENGYAEAAQSVEMSAGAFHLQVYRFRQKFRSLLRDLVGDTTRHAGDIDSELTVLLLGAS